MKMDDSSYLKWYNEEATEEERKMHNWFRQDKNAEKGLQKVHSSTSTIRPGGEP